MSLIIFVIFPFLQLEYSATKTTIIEMVSQAIRIGLSILLPTAFCTEIGQVAASIILCFVYLLIIFKKYKLKNDELVKKNKINVQQNN